MRPKFRRLLLAILPLAGLLWAAPVALARDHHPYHQHHYRRPPQWHHHHHWQRDAYRRPYYYGHDWSRSPDRYGYYRPYPDWYRWRRYYD